MKNSIFEDDNNFFKSNKLDEDGIVKSIGGKSWQKGHKYLKKIGFGKNAKYIYKESDRKEAKDKSNDQLIDTRKDLKNIDKIFYSDKKIKEFLEKNNVSINDLKNRKSFKDISDHDYIIQVAKQDAEESNRDYESIDKHIKVEYLSGPNNRKALANTIKDLLFVAIKRQQKK